MRVILSLVFATLISMNPAGGDVVATRGAVVVVLVMAALNVAWNAFRVVRPPRRAEPAAVRVGQALVDGALALIGAVLLDPTATPLAWVALLMPVLDAAALSPVAAAVAWLVVSLAYISLRMRMGGGDDEMLRLGLQQLAAVAAFALPAGYVAARMRDDLERAHDTLMAARGHAAELQSVAGHATRLSAVPEPDGVMAATVSAATTLGFVRVDVCRRVAGGVWMPVHGIGQGTSPEPDPAMGLDEAIARALPVVLGTRGDAAEDQWLHLTGYAGGVVVPAWTIDGDPLAVRAWSADELPRDASRVEALSLLIAQAGAAWGTARRFAELTRWSRRLEYDATHDAMTGLANRAQLLARLADVSTRAARGGPPFGLLYLDLNGFKQINDTHGHDAGDEVLRRVATRLREIVRAGDVVARLGGDEFVVLLTRPAELGDAVAVAKRACLTLSRPVPLEDIEVPIGTSVGIAWGTGSTSPEQIMRLADDAMYRAKRLSRSGFSLASDLREAHAAEAVVGGGDVP